MYYPIGLWKSTFNFFFWTVTLIAELEIRCYRLSEKSPRPVRSSFHDTTVCTITIILHGDDERSVYRSVQVYVVSSENTGRKPV